MIFDFIEKVWMNFVSVMKFFALKIRYGKRLKMSIRNSIRDKFRVDMFPECSLKIGKKISVLGPLYIKIINGGNLKIGDYCFFNRNCSISCLGNSTIGDYCNFANNIVIVDHDHDVYAIDPGNEYVVDDISIEDHVWVGANVVILKGVKIGTHSVIAAGSVVNCDVEPWSIYAGVPAKKVKSIK